jgi:hypothetical protein
MMPRRPVWLALVAALTLQCAAEEQNAWPFWVAYRDDVSGQRVESRAIGPIIVARQHTDGGETHMVRPLFLRHANAQQSTTHLLYPFFTWKRSEGFASFTFFQLINHQAYANPDGGRTRGFDVWPFYFSRETGDPGTSYKALLPVAGTIKHRFGKDALSWYAFPLYFQVEKDEAKTSYTPWPFIRTTKGGGHKGFEIWPLFGRRERPNDYRFQYYIWPLIYKQERRLDEAVPDVKQGFLPFYTRDTGAGYINENYLWPFFGYSDRTEPARYHETRYFWPFVVQGRGDEHTVNRWAPFYTHSIRKGYDKKWVMWPLYRGARWEDAGIAQKKDQLFYFIYWSQEQRSLANPDAAPAYKRHYWPVLSVWDNGAGRRQLQVFSPLEVFFPINEPMRQLYTPLFAVYRQDRRGPGDVRWSLLWGAASSKQTDTEREFNLGPLYGRRETAAESRIKIGAGLLSWRRTPGDTRWRFSLFDFRRSRASNAPVVTSP